MRKQLFAMLGVAFMAASLGACATDPVTGQQQVVIPIPSVIATNPDIQAIASQVQAAVITGCKYVAPISEVASIVSTFTGGGAIVDIVGNVANQICNAVTAQGARLGGSVAPQVHGIALHGHFLSGKRYGRRALRAH